MNQKNENNGRDQNIFNQPGTVNVDSSINVYNSTASFKLRKLESNEYILNYVLTLLSLIWYLVIWTLLGLLAKSEFPSDHAWRLITACLKGSEEFSVALNNEKCEIYQLREVALRARRNSKEENSRLNKLDSRIVVLENIIKRLYKEIETKEESTSKILSNLESKRRLIQIDLEPLKQQYDPKLYKLERVLQILLEGRSAAERDYEYVERVLERLIKKYNIELGFPSTHSASSLIQELRQIIHSNPDKIRYSRLFTLKSTLDLLQWVFALRSGSHSPEYIKPDKENSFDFDIESLFDFEEDSSEAMRHDASSDLFSLESLFGNELNDNYIDLTEVTEKTQGEFLNQSWLKLINSQIEKVVKRTTETSEKIIEAIQLGVEKEWIKRISVYGFDKQTGLVKVELALDIDWDNQSFDFQRNVESQMIDLDEVILRFNRFSRQHKVIADWRVQYVNPKNIDFYNRELGFERADSVRWATYGKVLKAPILGISNFLVELNFGPNEH